MVNTKIVKFFLIAVLLVVLIAPNVISSVSAADNSDLFGIKKAGDATGLEGGDKNADLRETIGNLIKVALGFLGVIAIVIVLVGGFKYMTAGGDPEKAKKARQWIISGIIGLAIILSAYVITTYVITTLQSKLSGTTAGTGG